MKTPVILRIFRDGTLVEVKQFDTGQIIFGQESDVHVQLQDATIAPIHALIELRDTGYYVCDLGSHSGTIKNGKPVLDEPLSSGDQVAMGPFTIHFFLGVPKPKAPPPQLSKVTAPPPPQKATPPAAPPERSAKAAPQQKSPVDPANSDPRLLFGAAAGATTATVPAGPPPSAKKQAPPQQPRIPDRKKGGGEPAHEKKPAGQGTFAPPSEIQDLRDYLKPTKGPVVEVLIAWRERVIQSYHYGAISRVVYIGPKSNTDIFVPAPYIGTTVPFLEVSAGGCRVFAPDAATLEVINANGRADVNELQRQGKGSRQAAGTAVRLDQGDLVCLVFGDGGYQIFVRYVPASPVPVLAPPLNLSSGELTAGIASLVLVGLFAFFISVLTPTEPPEKPNEEEHVATFVYNKPKPTPPPPAPSPTPPPPQPSPTPPKKVIKVTEKSKASAAKGGRAAEGRAAEIRPNPKKLPKKFGSIKQGGSVKMSNTESANAQSTKDVTKTGLLSAFGGGGVRKNLDKAYSGSGELLGMADRATGTSGQASDRAGDDIGSRFRETGGGKGTATQGIAGVGTRGRGSGLQGYGAGGLGGKGSVSVDPGGAEEHFEGSIDREAVRRVIRSILNQIKSCYERRLRTNSGLEGKVVIRFVIEDQGRVRRAGTKSSTLNDRQVESCVAARIREQRFPDPPAGTIAEVDYPFVFGMQK